MLALADDTNVKIITIITTIIMMNRDMINVSF